MANEKRKGKKTLTKRIYTGGIFKGPGAIKKRKKKLKSDLRVKYRKDKKAIKESPDWDNTNDEKLDKLLDKYWIDKERIATQSWKDRELIEDYGLRGARARSFMTERGEKYPKQGGGKVVKRKNGKTVGGSKTSTKKIKPKKKDPYAEGTGIPPGQKGTPPPSIFEQEKKKKLGRSPGAMGGKISISKRKKPPGLDKTTWEELKYVADQVSNTLMFAPNTVQSIYKGDIKPLTDRYKKILKTKKEYFTPKKPTNKKKVTPKKHGGKITYRMTGGQVVDSGYD